MNIICFIVCERPQFFFFTGDFGETQQSADSEKDNTVSVVATHTEFGLKLGKQKAGGLFDFFIERMPRTYCYIGGALVKRTCWCKALPTQ